MASLLILGGTGFFGKSFLDAFSRGLLEPWNVNHLYVVARHPENVLNHYPQWCDSRTTFLSGDIEQMQEYPSAEFVIHAASSSDAQLYNGDPEYARERLVRGTQGFYQAAKCWYRDSYILYVSSGAVYGNRCARVDEYCSLEPQSFSDPGKRSYAIAKVTAEQIMMQLAEELNINMAIARCFSFVGSWLPLDQHFAIGNFIRDGLQKKTIRVATKKMVVRSYMYADDLVLWLMHILMSGTPASPCYNTGSSVPVSVHHLATLVGNYFSVPVDSSEISDSEVDYYVPSTEKAEDELGLRMQIPLDLALDKTVTAIRKNFCI